MTKRIISLLTTIVMVIILAGVLPATTIASDTVQSKFSYDFLFNEHSNYLLTVPDEIKNAKNAYNNVIDSYSHGDYFISELDYVADNFFTIIAKEFMATNFNTKGAKDQLIKAATMDFIQCSVGNDSVNKILMEKVETVENKFKTVKDNINTYKKIKTNKDRIKQINNVVNCFSSKREKQLITYFENNPLTELDEVLSKGSDIVDGFDQSLAESAYIISIFEINTIYNNYLNELMRLVPSNSKLYEGLELISESASTKDPMDMIKAAGLNNVVTDLIASVFEKTFDKALGRIVSSTSATLIKQITGLTIDIIKNMTGVQDFENVYKTIYLSSFPDTFEKAIKSKYDNYIKGQKNVSEKIRDEYKRLYNLYIASITSTIKNANKIVKTGNQQNKQDCKNAINDLEGFTYETYIRACYNRMAEDGIVDGIIAPDFAFQFEDLSVKTKDDYKGKTVILIFGSVCDMDKICASEYPCLQEINSLAKLTDKSKVEYIFAPLFEYNENNHIKNVSFESMNCANYNTLNATYWEEYMYLSGESSETYHSNTHYGFIIDPYGMLVPLESTYLTSAQLINYFCTKTNINVFIDESILESTDESMINKLPLNYSSMPSAYGSSVYVPLDNYTDSSGKSVHAQISQLVIELTSNCRNDYEKAKKLYRWVADNINYDYDELNGITTRNREFNSIDNYVTFITRKGVCHDYTQLLNYMLYIADIPCATAVSNSINHSWSLAYCNDRWIQIDATWASTSEFEWFDFSDGILNETSPISANRISSVVPMSPAKSYHGKIDYIFYSSSYDLILETGTVKTITKYESSFDDNLNDKVYSYEKLNDNEISITHYSGDEDEIIIPSYIDGYKVVDIGVQAFRGAQLRFVEIPDTVKSIGNYAFVDNHDLTIYIPISVESIGECAIGYMTQTNTSLSGTYELIVGGMNSAAYDYYISEPFLGFLDINHTHTYNSKTTEATCIQEGKIVEKCSRCGHFSVTQTIPKKEHTFSDEWTIDKPANAYEEGQKSHHCTVCDIKSDITSIPETDMNRYANGVEVGQAALIYADQNNNWVNSGFEGTNEGYGIDTTITEDGLYYVKINNCSILGSTVKNINGSYGNPNINVVDDMIAAANGASKLYVDIYGLMDLYNNNVDLIQCRLVDIFADGEQVEFDGEKVVYGDLDESTDRYRIELYDKYGASSDSPAIDINELTFSEELQIVFYIDGIKSASVNNEIIIWKNDNSMVLDLTPETVTKYHIDKILAAIESYDKLSDEAKAKLTVERALLDSLLKAVDANNPTDNSTSPSLKPTNNSTNKPNNQSQNLTTSLITNQKIKSPQKSPHIATKANTKSTSPTAIKKAKVKNLKVETKGKKITVSWKKIKIAKGYQVQVATNKKFKKKKIVFDKFTKKRKLIIKSSKIKRKKTYYVRVRVYAKGNGKKVNGKWSKKIRVKIK